MARGDHTGERPIGPAAAGGGRGKKAGPTTRQEHPVKGRAVQGQGNRTPRIKSEAPPLHALRVWDVTTTAVAATTDNPCTRHAKPRSRLARAWFEKNTGQGDCFARRGRPPRRRRPRRARSVLQRRVAFCGAAATAPNDSTAAKTMEIRPRLDVAGGRALVCGVSDADRDPFPGASRRASCQRSFNWQSTAFVMRGLRVRLPPLAVRNPDDIAGDSPTHGNSSPPRHS